METTPTSARDFEDLFYRKTPRRRRLGRSADADGDRHRPGHTCVGHADRFHQGSFKDTGQQLDVAIEGVGFFPGAGSGHGQHALHAGRHVLQELGRPVGDQLGLTRPLAAAADQHSPGRHGDRHQFGRPRFRARQPSQTNLNQVGTISWRRSSIRKGC